MFGDILEYAGMIITGLFFLLLAMLFGSVFVHVCGGM